MCLRGDVFGVHVFSTAYMAGLYDLVLQVETQCVSSY